MLLDGLHKPLQSGTVMKWERRDTKQLNKRKKEDLRSNRKIVFLGQYSRWKRAVSNLRQKAGTHSRVGV